MANLQLTLLGGFEANGSSGSAVWFPTRKTKALLAYLTLNGERTHSRDKLAGLLWGASDEQHARSSLRQALSRLKKSLPPPGPCGLVADGDGVSVDCASFAVDVAEFERLATLGTPESLERAAGLYHGDLLDGLSLNENGFDEWLSAERTRLREIALGALQRLVDHYTRTGAIDRGIQAAVQLLALDPLQEHVHRGLIRFFLYQGRRGEANSQYQRCCMLLRRELGVEPEPETLDLFREIVGAKPSPANRSPAQVRAPSPSPGATTAAATQSSKPSIAVLAFDDLSDDTDQQYLSDGVADDVITGLARFRELTVIARNSSFAYRGATAAAQQIGRELNVHYLLKGSLRRSGARLRVAAQLVDTATGRHIWGETYDRGIEDIFEVQDELVRRIVVTLAGRIGDERLAQARRKVPEAWEAYDYWLQGMDCLRRVDNEATRRGVEAFRKALEIEPRYAPAHAGIAMAQFRRWTCLTWNNWAWLNDEAFDHALEALAIDEGDHNAQCIVGMIHLMRREYEQASRHLDRAVALNPNDAKSLANLAIGSSYLGEAAAAIEAGQAAVRLDPYHPDWYLAALGMAYFVGRRYDDAIATLERAPDGLCDTRAFLAAAYAHSGRTEAARKHRAEFYRYCSEHFADETASDTAQYVEWLLKVNPFRREADAEHLIDGLHRAGLSG